VERELLNRLASRRD